MIAAYALGVWAYCASPVMVRGFYALGDCATPVRIAAVMVALNLVLNLVLDLDAAARGGLGRIDRHHGRRRGADAGRDLLSIQGPAPRAPLAATAARTVLATLLMALAAAAALHWIPPAEKEHRAGGNADE